MPLLLESLGIVDRYRVRFLNVSANSPRKNLAGLVRAWIRATTRHDDAILVIKLSDYPGLPFESFLHRIALVQHELGKSLDEAAPLHFVRETFSDLAMARLYASFTHYISMSFGEGWDHPMVEAAASGLRLIAPGHSAYLAYLDSTVAHLIPCREVPAYMGNADQFLYEGANWWEPSEDDAIAFIRSAIEGRDLLPCSARDRVLREFSYEKVTRRLMDILEEFDPGPERRYL
jgi:glycosyltransferase involved in cell wall biosynthesis